MSIMQLHRCTRLSVHAFRRCYTTNKVIFLDEQQLKALDLETAESHDIALSDLPSASTVRRSVEADYGRKRIGCVELPKPLIKGIAGLVDEHQDKRLIREDALRLYEALRSTARMPEEKIPSNQSKKQIKPTEPHTVSYGPRESVAYAAGVLPTTYAAITNVFAEVSKRMADFKPKTMLDFGTGPGTAIWAAHEVFDVEKYVGVDLSEDMLRVAEQLEETTGKKKEIEFRRYLALDPQASKPDLVVSAFTLGDISSAAVQKSTVQQLWDQTGDVLILIDRGTPIGFSNIARARQWVLDSGDNVHVVAPCPHDHPCPLLFSPEAKPDRLWCHFSQRVQRPSFLMKTKHSKLNLEDSKYSYVVLRRGRRPEETDSIQNQAYSWPRLVSPPLKNKGHVVMDVCAQSGEIQRMIIPKSQGKIPYRDARKVMWGDLFPHPPKNKVVTRVSKGVQTE
ncbi:37S ribosomal protein S22 [Apophysomyces sp. BC1034]|nr:37S ribosomal protein S22 [Apophysomyces sp. BC1015]KAG0173285.1 37S ribosomal protein S22 [Apophysomyces sp. BC1021]KAG0188917.1 37S ribosomal protein S22 [Apophysomyces sp. BC1034]